MKKSLILILLMIIVFQTAHAAGSCQFCASACINCTNPASSVSHKPVQTTGIFKSGKASEIIAQVNAERKKYGLGAVSYDASLSQAAAIRAVEIADKFSHTRPDGTNWSTVSSRAYSENIARGYKTVDKVMAAWLTSDGHRKNILKKSYTSIGVAVYEENGILHWVQLFGKN